MLKLVPSRFVKQVDKVFPNASVSKFVLRADSMASVVLILDLFDRVPTQHYSLLSAEASVDLVTAHARMRAFIEQLKTIDSTEKRLTGGPAMGPDAALGNRHPVVVLREILATCPDDVVSQSVSTLGWLAALDADLAGVLRLDMGTAVSALSNREFKAACVMAGSVIEALLLWALDKKAPLERDAGFKVWEQEASALAPKIPGQRPVVPSPPKTLPVDLGEWKLVHLIEVSGGVGGGGEALALPAGQRRCLPGATDAPSSNHGGLGPLPTPPGPFVGPPKTSF